MIKHKKGYVLTWDAMIALVLITATIPILISMGYFKNPNEDTFERIHYISENAIDTMSKNTVLDSVLSDYFSGNKENAAARADSMLSKILERVNYRFLINDETLVEKIIFANDTSAKYETRATRFISGYKENETMNVFMARASLLYNDSNKNSTYTLANVSYGKSFKKASGANWTINQQGPVLKLCIPLNCLGDDTQNYKGNPCDDPKNDDAMDDAMFRLLRKLDIDGNCVLDICLDSDKMYFKVYPAETKQLGELTEVKLVVWL